MSVTTVVARVAELEARLAPPPPAQAATAASFSDQLASAQGSAGLGGVPSVSTAGDSTKYDELIGAAARRHGVDPALLKGLIRQESNFDPDAGSPAGAQGLAQLMPGTAAGLGVTNAKDPAQAVEGGAKYLKQQLDAFGGDVTKALAAYNAGPGAVKRYDGVPPYKETQHYVKQVQAYADAYRTAGFGGASAGASVLGGAASAQSPSAAAAAALLSPLGGAPSHGAPAPAPAFAPPAPAATPARPASTSLPYSTT